MPTLITLNLRHTVTAYIVAFNCSSVYLQSTLLLKVVYCCATQIFSAAPAVSVNESIFVCNTNNIMNQTVLIMLRV